MIDERQEELASLHAFGLLEGSEREQFLAEVAKSPELQRRMAELRESVSALAHTAPEAAPPPELKARILSSAAARAGGSALREDPAGDRRVLAFPTWVPWLMAACIGVAAVWTHRQYAAARSENAALSLANADLRQREEESRLQSDKIKALLAESSRQVAELSIRLKEEGDLSHFKIATLASMLGNTPSALAVAVWDPAQEQGVLSVSKLPALASEKDYQLWVIDKQYPAPVSAGVFVVDPVTGDAHIVFKANKPVGSIAKFAVSLERKGGASSPQGPIVLVSQ